MACRHALFNAERAARLPERKTPNSRHRLASFYMNQEPSNEAAAGDEGKELLGRRLFLQSMGKWSGAAIAAAVFGGAWLAFPPEAKAGGWVNRRGGGGGGWINAASHPGGTWVNGGAGGWVNRRGGGGAWVNR